MEQPKCYICTKTGGIKETDVIKLDEPFILFDLDGTCCEFRTMGQEYKDADGFTRHFHMEDLYEEGYFINLPPFEKVCIAVKLLKEKGYNVGICSAALSDSSFALKEKPAWSFDHIDPDIPVFITPCGHKKANFIRATAPVILVDDYSKNLHEWQLSSPLFDGVKMRNNINGTYGTWTGNSVSYDMQPEMLANRLEEFMKESIMKHMPTKIDDPEQYFREDT